MTCTVRVAVFSASVESPSLCTGLSAGMEQRPRGLTLTHEHPEFCPRLPFTGPPLCCRTRDPGAPTAPVPEPPACPQTQAGWERMSLGGGVPGGFHSHCP